MVRLIVVISNFSKSRRNKFCYYPCSNGKSYNIIAHANNKIKKK